MTEKDFDFTIADRTGKFISCECKVVVCFCSGVKIFVISDFFVFCSAFAIKLIPYAQCSLAVRYLFGYCMLSHYHTHTVFLTYAQCTLKFLLKKSRIHFDA